MPTVFIDNMAVVLPSRFSAGDVLTENSANLLFDIHLRRLKSKLRWLLNRGQILPHELQAKALELNQAEMVPYFTSDDDDITDDPVQQEAMTMAKGIIISRMASEGLPAPKNIELHAKALVDGMPILLERARLRIEARYQAANAAISSAS